MANNQVQLTVRPFGQIKDPITNNDEEVSEYTWTNPATKTVIKVSSIIPYRYKTWSVI